MLKHTTIAQFIESNVDILSCPNCYGRLDIDTDGITCTQCAHCFHIDGNIPQLFWPNKWDATLTSDVTDQIKAFYEETPFPNYDDLDSAASLIDKARQGIFAKLLDDQLPTGTRVLEAGCGTGQMTAFPSVGHRTVIGTDICMNSLKTGQRFIQQNNLNRAHFIQMNLFRPCFRPGVFDLVISNGVLHHTSNPRLAYKVLSTLVRPKGYFIVGLYHRYGRISTDLRRTIFRLSRDKFTFLDPRIESKDLSTARRTAWFKDQYKNPHESKHTIGEVASWAKEAGFKVIKTIPKTIPFSHFQPNESLFKADKLGNRLQVGLVETGMALSRQQIKEGGFFIVIAQKSG